MILHELHTSNTFVFIKLALIDHNRRQFHLKGYDIFSSWTILFY